VMWAAIEGMITGYYALTGPHSSPNEGHFAGSGAIRP